MNNAERIMRDVANIIYSYERGKVEPIEGVKKVLGVMGLENSCRLCFYAKHDYNCGDDHDISCAHGMEMFLREEAL